MRLGEILIAADVIDNEQLRRALSRRKEHPGRLGTQLIQLGYVTADQISKALSKQAQVPPVLIAHLQRANPRALRLLSAKSAAQRFILPIAFTKTQEGRQQLALCMRDPKDHEVLQLLESKLDMPVLACVASELAISVYLNKLYGKAEEEVLGEDIDMDDWEDSEVGLPKSFELVELDHADVERTDPGFFVPNPKRSSVFETVSSSEIAAVESEEMEAAAAEAEPQAIEDELPRYTALPELLHTIASAEKRSSVGDSIIVFLKQRFAAGLMFTVKDGLAMGHRGFGGHLDDPETVTALTLPLKQSILGAAHDSRQLWRGDPSSLSNTAQKRFLSLFGIEGPLKDVVVAPVPVGKKIACLLYAHGPKGGLLPDSLVEELLQVASATNQAFERLIRDARSGS